MALEIKEEESLAVQPEEENHLRTLEPHTIALEEHKSLNSGQIKKPDTSLDDSVPSPGEYSSPSREGDRSEEVKESWGSNGSSIERESIRI